MNRRFIAAAALILVLASILGASVVAFYHAHETDRVAYRAAHHCRPMPNTPEEAPQRRWLCDGGEVRSE